MTQKTARDVLDTVIRHMEEEELVPATVIRAMIRGQEIAGVTSDMRLFDFIRLCDAFTPAELEALRRGEDLVGQ